MGDGVSKAFDFVRRMVANLPGKDVDLPAFPDVVRRLQVALAPRHYVIGIAKAPVFALFIAVIGCRMGMSVSRDTRSIGINTTSTVVQGIVAVILLDAIFAVIFQELDL